MIVNIGFYDTLRTELSTSKVSITICNPVSSIVFVLKS